MKSFLISIVMLKQEKEALVMYLNSYKVVLSLLLRMSLLLRPFLKGRRNDKIMYFFIVRTQKSHLTEGRTLKNRQLYSIFGFSGEYNNYIPGAGK